MTGDCSLGVGVTVRKATGKWVGGGSRNAGSALLPYRAQHNRAPRANASQVPAAMGPGRCSQHFYVSFPSTPLLSSEGSLP